MLEGCFDQVHLRSVELLASCPGVQSWEKDLCKVLPHNCVQNVLKCVHIIYEM